MTYIRYPHKINLGLSNEEKALLDIISEKLKVTKAHIVREALDAYLAIRKEQLLGDIASRKRNPHVTEWDVELPLGDNENDSPNRSGFGTSIPR